MVDVIARDGGFLAIGDRSSTAAIGLPGVARLWASADGRSWEERLPRLGYEDARIVGGSLLDDGRLLLVGTGGGRFRSWTSQDAETWTEHEVPWAASQNSTVAYAGGPRGHIATHVSTIWFSSNGTQWQEVFDAGGDPLGEPAAGDEGFTLIRGDPGGDEPPTSSILASSDGVEWVETPPNQVWGVSPFNGDWLGTEHLYLDGRPRVLLARSANGLDWQSYADVNDLTPPDGPKTEGGSAPIHAATYASAGGIATMSFNWNHCCGELPQGVAVFTSSDGRTWTPVDLGEYAYVAAAAANEELIVLGGYLNRGAQVAFWILER